MLALLSRSLCFLSWSSRRQSLLVVSRHIAHRHNDWKGKLHSATGGTRKNPKIVNGSPPSAIAPDYQRRNVREIMDFVSSEVMVNRISGLVLPLISSCENGIWIDMGGCLGIPLHLLISRTCRLRYRGNAQHTTVCGRPCAAFGIA